MDCLLILRQRTPRPKFHGEKTFMNNHKTTKFEKKKFSLESLPLYATRGELAHGRWYSKLIKTKS